MRAEILEPLTRFDITPVAREDGTTGPPRNLSLSVRTCWRKPAVQLNLELLYELDGVAYYATTERGD